MPVIFSEYPKWLTINEKPILCENEAEEKEAVSKQKKKSSPKPKEVTHGDSSKDS